MHKVFYLFILLSLASPLQATTSQQDYAYRATLSETDQQLQRIELPLDVVLTLTRPDLADLAVFNINGKQLPHTITQTQQTVTDLSQQLRFHEFDRYLRQHSKTITTREQSQQAQTLSESQVTETIEVQSLRKDYLVELSNDVKSPVFERIELTWTQQPANQLFKFKVESGNELDDLRVINPSKSLTNRANGDTGWRSISNIPRHHKYLRLTQLDRTGSFELLEVTGHYRESTAAPVLTHRINPSISTEKSGLFYSFEFPSAVHAGSMRIIPGDAESVVSGDIYATWSNAEERKRLGGYRQHNIGSDDVKPSRPIKLARRQYDKIWFSSRAELAVLPRVELIYPQYELIFLADGNGPYSLAWGNHQSQPQVADLGGMLDGNLQQAQQRGYLVSLGSTQESGGRSRLAAQPELPWKKWLLWTLLVLGAIVTGRMAFKLYNEMNNPQSI